jgi:hypothetical protein
MVDYRIPFFGGAALSLISLTAVQMIRTPVKVQGLPAFGGAEGDQDS